MNSEYNIAIGYTRITDKFDSLEWMITQRNGFYHLLMTFGADALAHPLLNACRRNLLDDFPFMVSKRKRVRLYITTNRTGSSLLSMLDA